MARARLAKMKGGDALPHIRPAPSEGSAILACRAGDHHEREQMLFARMDGARARRLFPSTERFIPLPRRRDHGLPKPRIKNLAVLTSVRIGKRAHVVVTHPAPDDEDALIA